MIIETLEEDELLCEVGEDGAEGEDADGVPGSITISGSDNIDDFITWSSSRLLSDDSTFSAIKDNDETVSILSFSSSIGIMSWQSSITVFSDSVED